MTTDPPARHGAIRRTLARARGIVAFALAEIRHTPVQSALSILAITLAVLAVTLLASTGLGVLETGQQQFDSADRDLWITDGGAELSSSGLKNPILNAHQVAATAEAHDDVKTAAPLAFHATYIMTADGKTKRVMGVGLPNTHGGLTLKAGEGFSRGDVHYANGSYDGPRTDEIIIDRSTATALELEVGDTATVTTNRGADGRTVTVVGISSTYSEFLGAPTAAMPLSELQRLAGTTGSDRATFVTVTVADDADPAAVQQALADEFPAYEVQTNREQLQEMLHGYALILASAVTVVILAVIIGGAITLNVLVLSVVQRLDELAALHALGLSRGTLIGAVVVRSLVLGGSGAVIALALTPLLGAALNTVAGQLVGFSTIVQVTPLVYVLGGGVAAGITLLGSVAVGWYMTSTVDYTTLSQT